MGKGEGEQGGRGTGKEGEREVVKALKGKESKRGRWERRQRGPSDMSLPLSSPRLGVPLASWVRHASFLTPAGMPSSARMGAAAKPCFPPSQAPPAFPLPWPPASPAPAPLASLARGARPSSRTPVLPSVPKWATATSRPQAAHSAPACLDGQVSAAGVGERGQAGAGGWET